MLTKALRNLPRDTLTTLLDLVGLGLLVAAAALWAGVVLGVAAAGVAVLVVSVSLARTPR